MQRSYSLKERATEEILALIFNLLLLTYPVFKEV